MINRRMGLIVGITWTSTALILFAGLAVALSSDGIQTFDAAIRLSIHRWASPTLTELAQKVTVLGSVTFLGAAFVIAIAGFLIAGWRESAVALTWTMAGAVLLENGMKYAFHRVRPEPFFGTEPDTYSFPSGHALFSLCFYCVLANVFAGRIQGGFARAAIWTVTGALIAAIGVSRVYLGVHYPTDVIGGYLAAAFWLGASASIRSLRSMQKEEE